MDSSDDMVASPLQQMMAMYVAKWSHWRVGPQRFSLWKNPYAFQIELKDHPIYESQQTLHPVVTFNECFQKK